MKTTLTSLADLASLGVDDIIDVRSPAEFGEDHIPGAINLPVLSDGERAEVGTIYVQEDRFRARKVGAAYVSRNAAHYLQNQLADRSGAWQPLIYCWRGGQRSGSFASILSQVGWRVKLLEGGYKTYRALVVDMLYRRPLDLAPVLIDGNTGTAKTTILTRLGGLGHQVIDLEGLANHRGSLFGGRPGGQPSQKAFESRLAVAIAALDPARPVVLEAESNKIGECLIPPSLWTAMRAAPRIEIAAPLAERARYTVREYADLMQDPDRLDALLAVLIGFHGHARVTEWRAMAGAGNFEALVAALMGEHYDPRYARSSARDGLRPSGTVAAKDLSDAGQDRVADQVAALLATVAFADRFSQK